MAMGTAFLNSMDPASHEQASPHTNSLTGLCASVLMHLDVLAFCPRDADAIDQGG